MPVPINPYYQDGQPIKASDVQQVKQSVNNALTKTGKTFTWQKFPANPQDAYITYDAIDELKRATDVAYDALRTGCTTYNAVDSSYDSVDGYDSGYDGYDTGYCSDDSIDSGYDTGDALSYDVGYRNDDSYCYKDSIDVYNTAGG